MTKQSQNRGNTVTLTINISILSVHHFSSQPSPYIIVEGDVKLLFIEFPVMSLIYIPKFTGIMLTLGAIRLMLASCRCRRLLTCPQSTKVTMQYSARHNTFTLPNLGPILFIQGNTLVSSFLYFEWLWDGLGVV